MIKEMSLEQLRYNVSQLHIRLHHLALQMELAACELQEEKLKQTNQEFLEQFKLLKEVEEEITLLTNQNRMIHTPPPLAIRAGTEL